MLAVTSNVLGWQNILYKICRVIIICYVMNVGLYNNVMSLSVELLPQDLVVQSSRLMQCEISPYRRATGLMMIKMMMMMIFINFVLFILLWVEHTASYRYKDGFPKVYIHTCSSPHPAAGLSLNIHSFIPSQLPFN